MANKTATVRRLRAWLRALVDSDVSITVEHISGCPARPPTSFTKACPACDWLAAAGEVRKALGLDPVVEKRP